jgi:hypothetical protein
MSLEEEDTRSLGESSEESVDFGEEVTTGTFRNVDPEDLLESTALSLDDETDETEQPEPPVDDDTAESEEVTVDEPLDGRVPIGQTPDVDPTKSTESDTKTDEAISDEPVSDEAAYAAAEVVDQYTQTDKSGIKSPVAQEKSVDPPAAAAEPAAAPAAAEAGLPNLLAGALVAPAAEPTPEATERNLLTGAPVAAGPLGDPLAGALKADSASEPPAAPAPKVAPIGDVLAAAIPKEAPPPDPVLPNLIDAGLLSSNAGESSAAPPTDDIATQTPKETPRELNVAAVAGGLAAAVAPKPEEALPDVVKAGLTGDAAAPPAAKAVKDEEEEEEEDATKAKAKEAPAPAAAPAAAAPAAVAAPPPAAAAPPPAAAPPKKKAKKEEIPKPDADLLSAGLLSETHTDPSLVDQSDEPESLSDSFDENHYPHRRGLFAPKPPGRLVTPRSPPSPRRFPGGHQPPLYRPGEGSGHRSKGRSTRSKDPAQRKIDCEEFDKATAELERELMVTQKTRREELEANQAKELEEFHRRWTSIGKRKQYQHPSPQLTVLRKQLSFLLAQGRYKDADEVSALADEAAKVEEAENNAIMQKDCDEALVKLQEKQGQERDAFEAEATQERQRLSSHRQVARRLFEHRGRRPAIPRDETAPEADQFWNFAVVRTEVHRSHGYRYPKGSRPATAIVVPATHHPRQSSAETRKSQPL